MMKSSRSRWLLAGLFVLLLALATACGTGGGGSTNTPPANTGGDSNQEPDGDQKADFPTQPVKLIITHAAGGSTDNAIRILQPYLEKELGQPVVIENMVGAGGNVSRAFVYRQKGDGYTLLVSQFPSMMIGQLTQDGDFETREMVPIFQVMGKQAQSLAVKYDSPWQTFEDVVEASKSKRLTVSGPGLGSNGHLGYALVADAGVQADYVPFDSGPEALTAVAGGQVDLAMADTVSIPDLVDNKMVRVLVVTGPDEDHNVPGVPTLRDKGFEENAFEISIGVIAPPNTPQEIVDILAEAFDNAVNNPEFVEKATTAGFTPSPLGPEEFKEAIDNGFALVEKFQDLLANTRK